MRLISCWKQTVATSAGYLPGAATHASQRSSSTPVTVFCQTIDCMTSERKVVKQNLTRDWLLFPLPSSTSAALFQTWIIQRMRVTTPWTVYLKAQGLKVVVELLPFLQEPWTLSKIPWRRNAMSKSLKMTLALTRILVIRILMSSKILIMCEQE